MGGALALKLRLLRAERAWTIEEAARQAGVTPETISDAEHGKRRTYLPTLRKMAAGYGVPLEDLLKAEDEAVVTGKDKAPSPGLPEDLDKLMLRARELKAEWTRLMDYERMTRPGEYERVRPRLNEIERKLDELRKKALDLDAPRHMIMRWPNRPARVVFFEEPTEAEEAELRAQHGEYEEEHVFELASAS